MNGNLIEATRICNKMNKSNEIPIFVQAFFAVKH